MVFAQEAYQVLVGVPGVDTTSGVDVNDYVNALYALSISIAALLAVIKIVIGGVKWMTSDIVTDKGDAKKDIKGALVGLLIVLAAVLIISVINPQILEVNLDLDSIQTIRGSSGTGAPSSISERLNAPPGSIIKTCTQEQFGTSTCCPTDRVPGAVRQEKLSGELYYFQVCKATANTIVPENKETRNIRCRKSDCSHELDVCPNGYVKLEGSGAGRLLCEAEF